MEQKQTHRIKNLSEVFSSLPVEIINYIFLFCVKTAHDASIFSRVCKEWNGKLTVWQQVSFNYLHYQINQLVKSHHVNIENDWKKENRFDDHDYYQLYKECIYNRYFITQSSLLTLSNNNKTLTHTNEYEHGLAYINFPLVHHSRHFFEFEFHSVKCMAFFIGLIFTRLECNVVVPQNKWDKNHLGNTIDVFSCGLNNYGYFWSTTCPSNFEKLDSEVTMWDNFNWK